MSVQRIRKAILDQAAQQSEQIRAEATQRHEQNLQQARQRLHEEFEERLRKAKASQQREADRKIMQSRARSNMELLARRNQILDDLFQESARHLAESPDQEYREMLRCWMEEVPEDAAGMVLCNGRDADRVRPLVEELNESRGENAQLELVSGEEPELGGVIFRAETFEVDLSLESVVSELRQRLAPEVAEILFPEGVRV